MSKEKDRMLELAEILVESNYRSSYPDELKKKNKDNGGLTSNERANHISVLDMVDEFKKSMVLLKNHYQSFDRKDQNLINQFESFLGSLSVPMAILDIKKEKRKRPPR